MIEAKALQRIRHAEIKAEKIVCESIKECERKVAAFEKTGMKRIDTETEWAKRRGDKIVDYARKDAMAKRSLRIDECRKEIELIRKSCFSRRKRAVEYILREITGGADV